MGESNHQASANRPGLLHVRKEGETMRTRIARLGVVLGIIGTLLGVAPAPATANTGGSCTAPIVRYPEDKLAAFAGHTVITNSKVCLLYTGPGRVQFTRTPAVSWETRYPGAGFSEQLSLASAPTVVRADRYHVTYAFTIKQTILYIGSQTFRFKVHYTDSGHYLCLGSGCSDKKGW